MMDAMLRQPVESFDPAAGICRRIVGWQDSKSLWSVDEMIADEETVGILNSNSTTGQDGDACRLWDAIVFEYQFFCRTDDELDRASCRDREIVRDKIANASPRLQSAMTSPDRDRHLESSAHKTNPRCIRPVVDDAVDRE